MTPTKYAETALLLVMDRLVKQGLFADKKEFDNEFRNQLRNEVVAGLVTGDGLYLDLADPERKWVNGEDPTREWAAIATAYAIEAIMAERDGHQAMAWTYAVDAMFAANASRSGAIGAAVLQDARAARSSNGGKASAQSRREDTSQRDDRLAKEAKKLLAQGMGERALASTLASRDQGGLSARQIRRILLKHEVKK